MGFLTILFIFSFWLLGFEIRLKGLKGANTFLMGKVVLLESQIKALEVIDWSNKSVQHNLIAKLDSDV